MIESMINGRVCQLGCLATPSVHNKSDANSLASDDINSFFFISLSTPFCACIALIHTSCVFIRWKKQRGTRCHPPLKEGEKLTPSIFHSIGKCISFDSFHHFLLAASCIFLLDDCLYLLLDRLIRQVVSRDHFDEAISKRSNVGQGVCYRLVTQRGTETSKSRGPLRHWQKTHMMQINNVDVSYINRVPPLSLSVQKGVRHLFNLY